MATFRKSYHDFPRLAKQSGYFFQLYKGRVNWSEIENLNIDDIIDNKNFQMLEKNLINVVNCNLEKEYDLKVLDRNFVKLFKLAQLGIDYLSYCELYLDRCVVLLQEQLIALQEEYELLKQENAKRSEELRKAKKKSRIQSYQCEKCDKVFINDVYLKCHEKRRHCSPKTCKSSEVSPKTFIDKCQQTDTEEKLASEPSRSFLFEEQENVKETKENDELEMIKKENMIKIENLEKELEDIKSRLKKAETTLTTKCEAPISSAPQPLSFPNPGSAPNPNSIFYPPMLQWIPSYLPQPQINYFDHTQGYESLVVENEPRENFNINEAGSSSRAADSKIFSVNEPSLNPSLKDNICDKAPGEETINDSLSTLRQSNFQRRNSIRTRDSEKENIDPMEEKVLAKSGKPRLLPRKTKSLSQTNIEEETFLEKTPLEEFQMGPEEFRRDLITHNSTPLKEKHETQVRGKISEESGEEKPEALLANFSDKGIISSERKPKSFFKRILVKKSPKLQDLSKNLRTSLTSLYDSVSHGGKESRKTKESRSTVMDGLHGELRKLGIDPEWSGIPKNTVREKLKLLKHKRKLMTKENPLYPVVREGIEKNVVKKLDTYTNLNRKKDAIKREANEQKSTEAISLNTSYKATELTPYIEIESQSESDFDDLVTSHDVIPGQKMNWQKGEVEKDVSSNENSMVGKEFDYSVFQVSMEKDSKQFVTRDVLFDAIDDLEIVSDLGSQKSDITDNSNSQVSERRLRNGEENMSCNESKNKLEFSEGKHQNTPKSTLRLLSKPQDTSLKKRVVFIDLSENKEGETSEIGKKSSFKRQSIGKEDTWASKNIWDSCDGTMGGVG